MRSSSHSKRNMLLSLFAVLFVCIIISSVSFAKFFSSSSAKRATNVTVTSQVQSQSTTSQVQGHSSTPVQTSNNNNNILTPIEKSILDNIMHDGFNHSTGAEAGLWVNWQYGTYPLKTNINTNGVTDVQIQASFRHDPFTDLRYLHALWWYKTQNPQDKTYDNEIQRFTPIVKAEFFGVTDQRGWLYNQEFMDLYHFSQDSFYKDAAISLVTNFVKSINPKVGIWYKTSRTHPQGYYRPEDALEEGLALIQAGIQFNNPAWEQIGQREVNFVYAHAYIPRYHIFATQMDQVLNPDGSVNISETFYTDKGTKYPINGNIVKIGSITQTITALLQTYQVSHTQDFLNKALDLLNALSLPGNSLGLWDDSNLGYFKSVTFSGTTPQLPGNAVVDTTKKESGRQLLMLWAFHLADKLTNNNYADMERKMFSVATTKAYYAPIHGVVYEMTPDWHLLIVHSGPDTGQVSNWVTSESMGIELEALLEVKS
jgi:hypothetical protein